MLGLEKAGLQEAYEYMGLQSPRVLENWTLSCFSEAWMEAARMDQLSLRNEALRA